MLTLLRRHAEGMGWLAALCVGAGFLIAHDRDVRARALADRDATRARQEVRVYRDSVTQARATYVRAMVRYQADSAEADSVVRRFRTALQSARQKARAGRDAQAGDTSAVTPLDTLTGYARLIPLADSALTESERKGHSCQLALHACAETNRLLTAELKSKSDETAALRQQIPTWHTRALTAAKWALIGATAGYLAAHLIPGIR
jgi:hypothetical protein